MTEEDYLQQFDFCMNQVKNYENRLLDICGFLGKGL